MDVRRSSTSRTVLGGVATFATHAQWQVVFQCRGVILAAVTLGAIKIGLKTGAFPALFPNEAICADAEVAMVGFSNVCLGLLGVQGVAYSFSSLKFAEQVGASRRGVGLCLPLLCLLCWALGYAFLRHVPRFACGALLLDLGWDYVDTYLVGQISRGVVWTDVDVLAVFAVVATAIAASLLEAVAVGVVLCLAGTASRLARESVVAATLSGVDARSAVERSSRAQRRLDALGDAIRVLRLRGHVFFGSAPEVLAAATQRLDDPVARPLEHLVVDLEDCQTRALDLTAVETFQRLASLGDALGLPAVRGARFRLARGVLTVGHVLRHGRRWRGRWKFDFHTPSSDADVRYSVGPLPGRVGRQLAVVDDVPEGRAGRARSYFVAGLAPGERRRRGARRRVDPGRRGCVGAERRLAALFRERNCV